jgi:hypothetical protein
MGKIGGRFGKLVVLKEVPKPDGIKDKHKFWLCLCDCGNQKIVSDGNIGRNTISCGCYRNSSRPKKHGFASHKKYDKLYHTWNGIKYRCYNEKSKDYKHYGGRGITVCEAWLNDFLTFRDWAIANGYTDELTIDRIDVNGNYEPSNCRWITVAEQNRNKTTTKRSVNYGRAV